MGEIKSSYEVALERLRARGMEPEAKPLSEEQKRAIGEVRSEGEAKLAELDIMKASGLRKAETQEAASKLEARFAEQRAQVRRVMEERIEALRRKDA